MPLSLQTILENRTKGDNIEPTTLRRVPSAERWGVDTVRKRSTTASEHGAPSPGLPEAEPGPPTRITAPALGSPQVTTHHNFDILSEKLSCMRDLAPSQFKKSQFAERNAKMNLGCVVTVRGVKHDVSSALMTSTPIHASGSATRPPEP